MSSAKWRRFCVKPDCFLSDYFRQYLTVWYRVRTDYGLQKKIISVCCTKYDMYRSYSESSLIFEYIFHDLFG